MIKNTSTDVPKQPAQVTTTSQKDTNKLVAQGAAEISQMTAERREALGSKRGTLHFQYLVGLQSKPANVAKGGGVSEASFTPCGLTFISDEAIQVPQIDIMKNHKTGVNPEDVAFVQVAAGEKFVLSYIEAMFLFSQDQYAGHCEFGGDPKGVKLVVKTPSYFKGKQKLPTPTFELTSAGSIKDGMIAIDQKNAAGDWEAKPEFADKFGKLFIKRKANRGGSGSSNGPKVSKSTAVAVALQKILGVPAAPAVEAKATKAATAKDKAKATK